MNHKIKRKWCAALRGDTWKQVRGRHTEGATGRCVLAVLREVGGYEAEAELSFKMYPVAEQLVTMNDKEGKTFHELADWIEENVPEHEPVS